VLPIRIEVHDSHPAQASALIDDGIGQSNDAAAPLHEVKPVSCFALGQNGAVVGGAVGRRWGGCCELQQLWVEPDQRQKGVATQLMAAFERHAQAHGCSSVFLETFSFQAHNFYQKLGYAADYENKLFPHGISKFHMVKRLGR
jgi:GNAT superfamily N-acetyltransferase